MIDQIENVLIFTNNLVFPEKKGTVLASTNAHFKYNYRMFTLTIFSSWATRNVLKYSH